MLTAESIRDGFSTPIQPVRESSAYRLAVAAVAAAMVLLPLIYLGVVLLAAWGCYYYATAILPAMGRINALTLAPVVAGPILVLFLLKPLLARSARAGEPHTLERSDAPLLFELVDRLCDNVGAPRPVRIDTTVDVNASASLRRGVWSLFSNDLVLTIGLPLVQGLSLREFTAVLAHEFGHFRQGAGMGFNLIIRSINFWFARVVFERDQWDARLVRWSRFDWRISIMIHLARFFIWFSRKILHGLMLAGNALAGILSRQMEFDADQVAVRVAGHQAFSATMSRLPVLDLASQWAHQDLAQSWNKGKLGDDFPALVAANLLQLPGDQTQAAVDTAMSGTASMYASHPPTAQRIVRAEATPQAGVFGLDGMATELFADFGALCRGASLHSYRLWIGDTVTAEKLVSSEQVAADGAEALRCRQARERVFHGWFDGAVWFHLDVPAPPGSSEKTEDADAARQRADQLYARLIQLEQVLAYVDTGLQIPLDDFDLPKADRPTIEHLIRTGQLEFAAAETKLRSATAEPSRLAQAAIAVAPEAAVTLRLIERIEPEFNRLVMEIRVCEGLLSQLQSNTDHEQLQAVALAQGGAVYRALESLDTALGSDGPRLRLNESWRRDPEDHPVAALNLAASHLNRVSSAYYSALGQLAAAVESLA